MERYSRVFYINDNFYLDNSPVIILAGAILKDNSTDELIGQLKLKSLSNKKIESVEIELELYDSSGKKQEKKVRHEFLDLNISRNEEFGSNEAIKLPYENSKSFKVNIKKVIFSDGESWNNKKAYYKLEEQESLNSILKTDELKYFKKTYGIYSEYIPIKQKNIWLCSCGTINYDDEEECYFCKINKNDILNIDFEKVKQDSRAFKEKSKRTIIVSIMVITMLSLLLFVTGVIIPNKNYQDAKKLIEEQQYSKALKKLNKLPRNYKDTSEILKKCYISYAEQLIEEDKYEEAIDTYEKMDELDIIDFLDKQKYVTTTTYKYASYLESIEKYDEAYQKYAKVYNVYPYTGEDDLWWIEIRMSICAEGYIEQHNNSTDVKTYDYLLRLLKDPNLSHNSIAYKDYLSTYKRLYNVSCEVVINSEENDTSSAPTKIRRNGTDENSKLYFHYKVTSNIPNGKANLKTEYETYDDDDYFKYWGTEDEDRPEEISVPIGEWQLEKVESSSDWHRLVIYNDDIGEEICSSNEVHIVNN